LTAAVSDKQAAKFEDESEQERKDEEDYNAENHQAHMEKKMRAQSLSQLSGKPSRIIVESSSEG